MKKLFIVFGFLLFQTLSIAQAETLAIKNVSVIDVRNNKILRGCFVIIKGNKITALNKKELIPKGAIVLDATGKYLIPGLWDMHCHYLTDNRYLWTFPLCVANGITAIRDMGTNIPLERIHQVRKDVLQGKIVGPRLSAVTGRILDGKGSRVPVSRIVENADSARYMVDTYKNEGADFIKVYELLTPEVYQAIAVEAKKQNIPFEGHVPFSMTAAEVSAMGQKTIEHATDLLVSSSSNEAALRKELIDSGASGQMRIRSRVEGKAANTYDEQKAIALSKIFVQNNTWQCPTLITKLGTTFADPNQYMRDERFKYLPKSMQENWRNIYTRGIPSIGTVEERTKRFRLTEKIVGVMFREGVPILAGTDAAGVTYPGFGLHDELELLVEAGLSPIAALRTATINPALFLGREKEFGTVDKGKVADWVLLDANPLENISNTKNIYAVILNGKLFRRSDLDNLLLQVEEKMKE